MAKRPPKKNLDTNREEASLEGLSKNLTRRLKQAMPSLKPTRRKGSRNWQATGTVGRRRRFSLKTESTELAWEACIVRSAELYREHLHKKKPRKTLVDAATAYERRKTQPPSQDAMRKLSRALRHFEKGVCCDEVDQDMIDEVGDRMFKRPCQPATVGRDLNVPIKALLTFAHVRGWCPRPAFEQVQAGDPSKVHLTPPQAERLVRASPRLQADLWVFCACYGHHLSELTRLRRADVDLHYNRLSVRMKSPAGRVTVRRSPLFPRIRTMMERILAEPGTPKDHLFRDAGGGPIKQVGRLLESCLRASGVEAEGIKNDEVFTHRNFRTTMATWLLSATRGAMKTVMTFGGWRTLRMVDGYTSEIDPRLKPDILAFYGLPPETDLVAWLDMPDESPSDAGSGGYRKRV